MRRFLTWFRRCYGENPLHLLALLGCFALSAYVVFLISEYPTLPTMAIWFAGAVVGHDFVLFPLYAVADRSLGGAMRSLRPSRRSERSSVPDTVPATNHIRVPALGAGLTFAVFYPGIVQQGEQSFHKATGLYQDPYLERWLLLVAAMFLLSALIYALRLARATHHVPSDPAA